MGKFLLQALGCILQTLVFTFQTLEYTLQTLQYKKSKAKKSSYSVAAFNISPKVGWM